MKECSFFPFLLVVGSQILLVELWNPFDYCSLSYLYVLKDRFSFKGIVGVLDGFGDEFSIWKDVIIYFALYHMSKNYICSIFRNFYYEGIKQQVCLILKQFYSFFFLETRFSPWCSELIWCLVEWLLQ